MNTAFLRRLGAAAVAVIAAIAVLALALTGFAEPVSAAAVGPAGVSVNGRPLSPQAWVNLQQATGGVTVRPGRYWYDATSGLWGQWNGPAQGALPPGLPLGVVPRHASSGTSGVVVNGRELQRQEALLLARLAGAAQPYPGFYHLSAQGILAGMDPFTGQPFAVSILARSAGDATFYRSPYLDVGGGSQGGCNYVIGGDFSYAGSGC